MLAAEEPFNKVKFISGEVSDVGTSLQSYKIYMMAFSSVSSEN